MNFQPKISEVVLSKTLKKNPSPGLHMQSIPHRWGLALSDHFIHLPTKCQEITLRCIECPFFSEHFFLFVLYTKRGEDLPINNHLDFCMQFHSLLEILRVMHQALVSDAAVYLFFCSGFNAC